MLTDTISQPLSRTGDFRALLYRETRLLTRDRTNLLLASSSALIYICLFGSSMSRLVANVKYGGTVVSYSEYTLPALLVFSMVAGATTAATSTFQERLAGMDVELWSYPLRPSAYVAAKVVASIGMVLVETALALALGLVLFDLSWPLSHLPFVAVAGLATAACLTGAYLLLAVNVADFQRFLIVVNVLGPVMLFASDSFYPVASMPLVLRWVAWVNPLTYGVRVVRDATLFGASTGTIALTSVLVASAAVCWSLVARSLVRRARFA